MFDAVAPTYDLTNGLLSMGQDRVWRKVVAKAVDPKRGQRVLDLAAGTGTSSMAFLRPGVEVVASDFSEGMLAEGRKRHPELQFVFADATALPFKDAEFDAVTISFGLRNVVDVDKALAEMYRVTKPGGRIVICEFSHVSTPVIGQAYRAYLGKILPAFSGIASKTPEAYAYLAESILAWPKQSELAKQIAKAGFERVEFRNLNLGVVAVHRGFKAGKAAAAKQAAAATKKAAK